MKLIFPVSPEADGALLRNFLRRCAVSTELARAVKFHGSGFWADGQPILANRRVEAGQNIWFELPAGGAGVAPQPEIPVQAVYEDAFAIVLDKPPHLAVHPTLNYPLDTLANGYAARMEARGESPVFRPVNRIDKDTSGLVALLLLWYTPPSGREHHRPVCDAGRQAQPDGVYHNKSRARSQPGCLRPGDGADAPDPGPLCLHRPPAGRG